MLLAPYSLAESLRDSAGIYLQNAVKIYLSIEGKVSIYSDDNLGDSANIICSLKRSAEHLFKLKLALADPILLYPIPKKIEEYLKLRHIDVRKSSHPYLNLANTIGFKEAIERVKLLKDSVGYNFSVFCEINSLRNSLEHHWDHNEKFLIKNLGIMSKRIIPSFREFVEGVLHEDFSRLISKAMIEDIDRLDRATIEGHTLNTQRRLEYHRELYKENPESVKGLPIKPKEYSSLEEVEVDANCPVCSTKLSALWDFEVDYDENGPVAAFPDAKCLYCQTCRFYIDGVDVTVFLPDGLYEYFKDADWYEDPF